jgi:hypothetical protein
MRNLLALLAALAVGLGSALAQQGTGPLLGPGNVGEKDEKGRVKGAGAGEGPHLDFNHMQLERRVDRPEGEAEKDHKDKGENARSQGNEGQQEGNRGQSPNSASGNTGSGKQP